MLKRGRILSFRLSVRIKLNYYNMSKRDEIRAYSILLKTGKKKKSENVIVLTATSSEREEML